MTMHNYAASSKFADKIKQMHSAETSGSQLYFVLAFLAKEKGLEDLAEAMLENAMEDSLHGGMYGAMLGKGREDDASFWKQVINLYRLEAGAGEPLRAMAGEVRAGGEEELARCIESTIGEELEHARRLEAVFKARGIDYLKQPS